MLFIFSALPIVLLFTLILIFRRSALFSSICSLAVLVILSIFVWGMAAPRIISASLKGVFIATEIIIIVFGALLIFEILLKTRLFSGFKRFSSSVSHDLRVQIMLIAMALVCFIEGAAGFGTPALVAVPILMSLGLAPVFAVSLALIGDTAPVIFGAIGLPVTYGIGASLIGVEHFFSHDITLLIALLNIPAYFLLSIILTVLIVYFKKEKLKHAITFLPFALVSASVISISSAFAAFFLGPELPSVFGGLVGIAMIFLMAKNKLFLPKEVPVRLRIKLPKVEEFKNNKTVAPPSILKTLTPYIILTVLLLLSRLVFSSFRELGALRVETVLGQDISFVFFPLYSASTIMIMTFFISALFLRFHIGQIKTAFFSALIKIRYPYFSLLVLLAFVQIFIYSDSNNVGVESMPVVLADGVKGIFGGVWPLFAPMVGALGAFVAGSATVSNLLFSEFQYNAAMASGFSPELILSLQGLGAAAGNAIALHNVIAALAVAGIVGRESRVLRKNFPPLLVYLLSLGIIGLIASFFFF